MTKPRPQERRPAQQTGSGPQSGWILKIGPNLEVGNGMPTAPNRWYRFWQRVLCGFTWTYRDRT